MAAKPPARFSCLYESELDYAKVLVRYAQQDGLELTVRNGRLMIGVGSKSGANLLGELRLHESIVIACLREGARNDARGHGAASGRHGLEKWRPERRMLLA
jgi:hypothetical protein